MAIEAISSDASASASAAPPSAGLLKDAPVDALALTMRFLSYAEAMRAGSSCSDLREAYYKNSLIHVATDVVGGKSVAIDLDVGSAKHVNNLIDEGVVASLCSALHVGQFDEPDNEGRGFTSSHFLSGIHGVLQAGTFEKSDNVTSDFIDAVAPYALEISALQHTNEQCQHWSKRIMSEFFPRLRRIAVAV